jgi:hypothetical protein
MPVGTGFVQSAYLIGRSLDVKLCPFFLYLSNRLMCLMYLVELY